MLKTVLHTGETLSIGENVKILVAATSGSRVQVVVDAPKDIRIAREKKPEEDANAVS